MSPRTTKPPGNIRDAASYTLEIIQGKIQDDHAQERMLHRDARFFGFVYTKSWRCCSMQRNEALAILQAHTNDLKMCFGVQSLYLFGSTARNEASETSDVDILVEFAPEACAGLFELYDLKTHIENMTPLQAFLPTKQVIVNGKANSEIYA